MSSTNGRRICRRGIDCWRFDWLCHQLLTSSDVFFVARALFTVSISEIRLCGWSFDSPVVTTYKPNELRAIPGYFYTFFTRCLFKEHLLTHTNGRPVKARMLGVI